MKKESVKSGGPAKQPDQQVAAQGTENAVTIPADQLATLNTAAVAVLGTGDLSLLSTDQVASLTTSAAVALVTESSSSLSSEQIAALADVTVASPAAATAALLQAPPADEFQCINSVFSAQKYVYGLEISSTRDGFRRAGRAWRREPEFVQEGDLTDEEVELLMKEPNIRVAPARRLAADLGEAQ